MQRLANFGTGSSGLPLAPRVGGWLVGTEHRREQPAALASARAQRVWPRTLAVHDPPPPATPQPRHGQNVKRAKHKTPPSPSPYRTHRTRELTVRMSLPLRPLPK